jgi:RimJ/RimL family protein N-acetyltransferase
MPEIRLPDPPLSDGAVTLRPWRDSDLPAIVAACQDPEIPRWTRVPSPYTEQEGREFLAAQARQRLAGEAVGLAVVDAGGGEILGAVGVMRIDPSKGTAEVGYWVARPARRRGVATRAVRLVSRWALAFLGLARLELLAEPDNLASQRVAERSGYAREGLLRSYQEIKGRRRDYVLFSLLPTDEAARK